MEMNKEIHDHSNEVEVRALMFLKKIFEERNWSFPYFYKLEEECSSLEFAKKLDLPLDKIEAVFINGKAWQLEEGIVKAGDRVTFLSQGAPGPYRFLLGVTKLPENKRN